MSLTVTDHFAGAGGSSTGMVQIPGVRVTQAANHWKLAIEVHNHNHPDTDHAAVDLHMERPSFFKRTDVLWASPECTKWSQASGKAREKIEEGLFADPLSDEATHRSRLLMFDVLKFVEHHRYSVVIVENVVDIAVQAKYRLAWYEWRRQLTALGYEFRVVSLNAMHAQTFGMPAPQSRDRIFIVAWIKGNPVPDLDRILRPKAYCPKCDAMIEANQSWKGGATVGRYRQSYVYVHGACGTVVEPGYLPAYTAIDWSLKGDLIGDRLAAKTRARIAAGIARYWMTPTVVPSGGTWNEDARSVEEALRTLTTREAYALAVPVEGRAGKDAQAMWEALRTQTTRAETALATAPFMAELRGGHSETRPLTEPAATFTASGNHHALITRHYGVPGGDPARHSTPVDEFLRTITGSGGNMSLIQSYYGNGKTAKPVSDAMDTVTTVDRHALIMRNNHGGSEMSTPVTEYLRTITTAAHQSLVHADPRKPRPAVDPGDLRRAEELVSECYLRMLQPHEAAAGMAFPRNYRWDVKDEKGKTPSKRDLVKMAGNAVCPPCSRDIMGVVADAYAA
jgi:DNA (cytosine-5)-methyltransferase 1